MSVESTRTGISKFGSSAHRGVLKAMDLCEIKYRENVDRQKAQTKIWHTLTLRIEKKEYTLAAANYRRGNRKVQCSMPERRGESGQLGKMLLKSPLKMEREVCPSEWAGGTSLASWWAAVETQTTSQCLEGLIEGSGNNEDRPLSRILALKTKNWGFCWETVLEQGHILFFKLKILEYAYMW